MGPKVEGGVNERLNGNRFERHAQGIVDSRGAVHRDRTGKIFQKKKPVQKQGLGWDGYSSVK